MKMLGFVDILRHPAATDAYDIVNSYLKTTSKKIPLDSDCQNWAGGV